MNPIAHKSIKQYLYQIWKRYCDETTLHGFREAFYARSFVCKLLWALIVLGGIFMTVYQIKNIIRDYGENPRKTQITFLSPEEPIKYPPIQFCSEHWMQWINFSRIQEIEEINYETLIYAMSFYNPIHTHLAFNVTKAKLNLEKIMKTRNISDMINLAMSLGSETPNFVTLKGTFSRYLISGSKSFMCYASSNFQQFNSTYNLSFSSITIEQYSNFRTSPMNAQLAEMFNVSFHKEYRYYHQYSNNDEISNGTNPLILLQFNPLGTVSNFGPIDVAMADYEHYLKGSYYKWIPMDGHDCNTTKETYFYADCEIMCRKRYPLLKQTPCFLSFLSAESELQNVFEDESVHNNSCQFDNLSEYVSIRNITVAKWQQCMNDCNNYCYKWVYETSLVMYPKTVTESHGEVKGRISMIYPHHNNVLVIALLPAYSWNDAVANIGGLLGLWLGGSILSFLQLIYSFLLIPLEKLCISWKKRRRHRMSIKKRCHSNHHHSNLNCQSSILSESYVSQLASEFDPSADYSSHHSTVKNRNCSCHNEIKEMKIQIQQLSDELLTLRLQKC